MSNSGRRSDLSMTSDYNQDDRTQSFIFLTPGTAVSHYRIIEKIGSGGMGEVYLAEDTELNRGVALKFLPPHLSQDPDCRARFKREAQAAAKLGHANIVAVHEVGEHQGRPFFAMELVEGRPLNKIVNSGRLSQDEIVELALGICNGLRKAHESGVIHRDIKPSNIIVDRDNVPRVLDFGLAVVRDSDRLTQTGSTPGTIGYMSPEQLSGRDADARSDLFSFGVVLYELITGTNPFLRDNQAATLKAISEDIPRPLGSHRSGISGELQRIVSKLLEKKPEHRYQTAADIGSDLRRLLGTAPAMSRWSRKHWFVSAGIAVVLIGAIAVGYFLTGNQTPEPTRKMLAVLPFENLSPDPDQEYFSDGLTEELTSTLSQIQSLCVISRSSSMTFKGSNKTLPEIAKALKVQYIVEGSVRRAGNELRITAQLIDANADAHLWSKTYSGTLNDVFDMQDSVSRAIVDAIAIQLTPNEKRRLEKRAFNNAAAFTYYLRGKAEIDKGTAEAMYRGLEYLQQGIDLLGDNAIIFIGMAWGHWMLVNSGVEQEDGVSRALEYSQKALELDPELPEAFAIQGWINSAFMGNQSRAVELFKKALVLDPSNSLALAGLAIVYYEYVGRASSSTPLIEKRNTMFPLDSLWRIMVEGDIPFFAGRFQQALEPYRIADAIRVDRSACPQFFYVLALAYCDSIREAFSLIDGAVIVDSTSSVSSLLRIAKSTLCSDKAAALSGVTSDLRRTCKRDAAWSYHLGALLTKAGAAEEAWDWLENAVNRGFINYPFWEKDPFLDSIRGDERFKKLMERVKYEWEHFEV